MSGLRLLIYPVKYSLTELSNAASRLSIFLEKSSMIHYKDLLCEIKYVIDKKYYFYQIKSQVKLNLPWELRGYSDAEYVGDNNTWKSVTGYIVLIDGLVIKWISQILRTVTLIVTETEYSDITKLCCKKIFLRVILLFTGVFIEYPNYHAHR